MLIVVKRIYRKRCAFSN